MAISTPVVNAGFKYINGLQLQWLTTTTLTVTAGQCRNSTNVNDISVGLAIPVAATQTGVLPVDAATGNVTINGAATGAAGLDTGDLANNTFYGVYAIGDSFGVEPGSALISASLTSPLLPAGYDMFFRIGFVKTDGSAHFLEFRQDGIGLDRWMTYDTAIATDITAGTSATFAAVSLVAGVPNLTAVSSLVNLLTAFTPTAAADKLALRPGNSSSTNGCTIVSCDVAGVAHTSMQVCPFDSTTGVDYKVTGTAVALSVAGYLDQLGV